MEGSIDSHRTSNLITYAILGLTISIHTSSVIDTLFAITTATFARNITMWISLVIAHQRALDTTLRRATPRLFTRLSVRHLCPAVCTAHHYLIKSEPLLSQVHVHRRFDTLNKHRQIVTSQRMTRIFVKPNLIGMSNTHSSECCPVIGLLKTASSLTSSMQQD